MNFPTFIKEFTNQKRLSLFRTIISLTKARHTEIKFLKSIFEATLAETLKGPSAVETIGLIQDLSQLDICFREDFIIKVILRCLELEACPELMEKMSKYFVDKYLEKFSKNQINELVRKCHECGWWKFAQKILESIDHGDWRFNSKKNL